MGSFVDKVRTSPPSDRRVVTIVGVDPDIHVMGLACLQAEVGGSLPIHFTSLVLLAVENILPKRGKTTKSEKQHFTTAAMCGTLGQHHFDQVDCGADLVLIESQDFYADRNMKRSEMVAKANALIACATITGRAVSLALERRARARTVAPSEWKHNRSKDADQARTIKAVAGAAISLRTFDPKEAIPERVTLENLPPKYEHALDGLGIALYGVEQLHRGTWT